MSIVAVAFVTIVGLLTTGLTISHDSMTTTVGSQIAQQVINSVQQSDYTTLETQAGAPTVYYFDDQGNELTASNASSALYEVNVVVAVSTLLPGAATANSNLATIQVQVAMNPGHVAISDFTHPPSGVSVTTYSTQVANAT